MRFDADDVLEPGALTALAAALDARPDAVAASGDVQTWPHDFPHPGAPRTRPVAGDLRKLHTGSGNLIRRDPLVKAGGGS